MLPPRRHEDVELGSDDFSFLCPTVVFLGYLLKSRPVKYRTAPAYKSSSGTFGTGSRRVPGDGESRTVDGRIEYRVTSPDLARFAREELDHYHVGP